MKLTHEELGYLANVLNEVRNGIPINGFTKDPVIGCLHERIENVYSSNNEERIASLVLSAGEITMSQTRSNCASPNSEKNSLSEWVILPPLVLTYSSARISTYRR
jgi:hypothetical protein